MPGNVFISYRRVDTPGHAGRLYDHLKACFSGRVFIDVGAIPPGTDFVKAIELQVGNCAALVALIGNRWATDDRLHNPEGRGSSPKIKPEMHLASWRTLPRM